MKLKSNIRSLVEDKGFKKSFVAAKIKVSVPQFRNYETGHSLIPMDKAFTLAKLLGVKVDDLYEEEEE